MDSISVKDHGLRIVQVVFEFHKGDFGFKATFHGNNPYFALPE